MHAASRQRFGSRPEMTRTVSIVSDLASLIEHVQASLRLIESAIDRESYLGDQEAADVVVLDDVTPSKATPR